MLARLRMSVKECIQEYLKLANDVFGDSTWKKTWRLGSDAARYSEVKLEQAFKDVIGKRETNPNTATMISKNQDSQACRWYSDSFLAIEPFAD